MDAADLVAFVLVLGIIVVSLLSNIVVLICFVYNPEIRKQVPGLFILNLTFCNLLLSVSNMPLTLIGLITTGHPGGSVFLATCRSWVGYHHLYASCTLCNVKAKGARTQFIIFTVALHSLTFLLTLIVLCVTYLKVLKVARFHCKRIDVITMQTLVLLVDIHPSVRQKCLDEQKRRRLRATKKISTFIGTFVVCFTPYVITRIVEIFSPWPISPYWGVLSKCLAYSKAACDPFVYSLLRHQYRKTCSLLANKILKRSPLNSSSLSMENNTGRSNSNTTNNIQLPANKPLGQ
ncbi:G-protein coupled receptor 26 [Collichthys lucidus]|uniref:G-protein coupled receptor 26 n=1 Tax=Collichthys lucidus TaxID=240159 RepID=A0A4U5VCD2_COLLU|nr:G-protein coupled receptor 26 [Collichthys lucidus]